MTIKIPPPIIIISTITITVIQTDLILLLLKHISIRRREIRKVEERGREGRVV